MKLLLLDMDGTVRVRKGATAGKLESGFIQHPTDQEIIPGAAKAIEKYCKDGWIVVGASNQGGVASKKKSLENCFLEQQYTIQIEPHIKSIFFCPDYEGKLLGWVLKDNYTLLRNVQGFDSFRKPGAGMPQYIIDVCRESYGRVEEVLFIGDRPEDEACAIAADIPFQWAANWWL